MSTTALVISTFDENDPKYISCCLHIKRRTFIFCLFVNIVNFFSLSNLIRNTRYILKIYGIMQFWEFHKLFFIVIEIALLLITCSGIRKTKSLYLVPAMAYMAAFIIGYICLIPLTIVASDHDSALGNETISFMYLTIPANEDKSYEGIAGTQLSLIFVKLIAFSLGLYLAFKCYKYICDKEKHEKDEEIIRMLRDAEPL